MKSFEDTHLDTLLAIIAKRMEKAQGKVDQYKVFRELRVIKGDFDEGEASEWAGLVLTPVLDASLLELLRLVLRNDPNKVLELVAKLTSSDFSHEKRLACVKILSKALEHGNEGAELVLTKTLSKMKSNQLTNTKKDVENAIRKASAYTTQYLKISEPAFNPQPKKGYDRS